MHFFGANELLSRIASGVKWRINRRQDQAHAVEILIFTFRYSLLLLVPVVVVTAALFNIDYSIYRTKTYIAYIPLVLLVITLSVLAIFALNTSTELSITERKSNHRIVVLGFVVGFVLLGLSGKIVLFDEGGYHDFGKNILFCTISLLGLAFYPFLRNGIKKYLCLILIIEILIYWTSGRLTSPYLMSFILISPFMTEYLIWTVSVMREMVRNKELESELKINRERLRFSQELHDTMGQHLAVMSLKTELALAHLRKESCEATILELESLQKLVSMSVKDMRAVVDGYRKADLRDELETAKRLLLGAGIEFTIIGSVASVPKHFREHAAWLVREAITNILKHSVATIVVIQCEPTLISVSNDGASEKRGELRGLMTLERQIGKIEISCKSGDFIVTYPFNSESQYLA